MTPPGAPGHLDDATVADAAQEREEVEALESRLDQVDVELLGAVRRRTALARRLADLRISTGQPAFAHQQELLVVRRFMALGPAGRDLAALLLRMARSARIGAGSTPRMRP